MPWGRECSGRYYGRGAITAGRRGNCSPCCENQKSVSSSRHLVSSCQQLSTQRTHIRVLLGPRAASKWSLNPYSCEYRRKFERMAGNAEAVLKKLRRLETNMVCPNCGTNAVPGVGFGNVCVKFKTFICDLCKTSHQAISHRVKSFSMSTWTMDEVLDLSIERHGGNPVFKLKQYVF